MNGIEQLQEWIDQSKRIVFFGGAGVSTESGIPDFRSADGLYRQACRVPPETILSHRFFEDHPTEFFEFYRAKMLCLDAKPNAAHRKLAELEQKGKLSAVVTQNIDGLHQAAGSRNVLELHGSVLRNFCMRCRKSYRAEEILHSEGVPRCDCGGIMKPDVVLYGECLNDETVRRAVTALQQADLVIVGGTSLAVYPAAGLLESYSGDRLVLLNRSPTPLDRRAGLVIAEPIGETLSKITV